MQTPVLSEGLTGERKIAYFTMELGISPHLHTYSGGLGILAGDTLRSAADLNIPLVVVTLVNKAGYFRQELTTKGEQIEHDDSWLPEEHLRLLEKQAKVKIENRTVRVKAWLYVHRSSTGGVVPAIFLDTDVSANAPEDREITAQLYGGDNRYRLKQEIVLGIGGVRMLQTLDVRVEKYHMNEGHSAFLVLELLRVHGADLEAVRRRCVFTTHTPVKAGHDRFDYGLVDEVLSELVPRDLLTSLAGRERLNMTRLALNASGYVNGVAKGHRTTTEKLFPGYTIRAITNGVHPYTWTHPAFRALYDRYVPGWANEPELLVRVALIPDGEIVAAHHVAKVELLELANARTRGTTLSPHVFTIGFARRATRYKRHAFFFSDIERVKSISKRFPFQLIFAGKAHPNDTPGKQMIREIFAVMSSLDGTVPVVYLENYDMEMAKKLVSGVDLWLNTPERPMEASGTSGMKAAHNGVPNFSVLDGWWAEGCIEGLTGWAIGPRPEDNCGAEEIHYREKEDLYGKLEYVILPLYYNQPDRWVDLMEEVIGKTAYYFNSHRMMRRYITEAYFR